MTTSDWIIQHETTLRLAAFIGTLLLMAAWELLSPRRRPTRSKPMRWLNNLGLVVFNTIVLRLLLPTTMVALAMFAQQQHWGLLNYYQLPTVLGVAVTIVVLDLVIYLQHVMVHAIPLLWRLHRVHHADPDFDVTTGVRVHPLELILSMLVKYTAIIVLGPPVLAVILFEILLNAMAMFNHGNVKIPATLDRIMRLFVVTPDMHRVHHSIDDDETNSNFGFNLSCWDRLFGTYRRQPRAGQRQMKFGIRHFDTPRQVSRLQGMLILPFLGRPTDYTLSRRKWNGPGPDLSEKERGRT